MIAFPPSQHAFILFFHLLAKRPLPRPLYTLSLHRGSLDHHPFRPASVTLNMGKHESVDLLGHSQDTAIPPATAFVTTPPCFRSHPSPESVNGSKSVRVNAIAHFACSPLCSHYVPPSHTFSYLARCPYFAFFSPSCCLLISCLLLIPTLALFPYSIFHSLPIQTSIQSESCIDWAIASPSSLISYSEPSSPSHTPHAYSTIHPHRIFLSDPNPFDLVNVLCLIDGTGAQLIFNHSLVVNRGSEFSIMQKEPESACC